MSQTSQAPTRRQPPTTRPVAPRTHDTHLVDTMDELLDAIDEILEEEDEFLFGFRQRGGE